MLAEQTRLAAKKKTSTMRAALLALVAIVAILAPRPASASTLSRAQVEASAAENSRLGIFSTFGPISVGETLANPAERIGESGPSRTKNASESREWSSPDPSLPAFVRGDGSGGGLNFPRNLELYSYALNNPVDLRDPNGREWFPSNLNPLGAAGQFIQDTAKEVSEGLENSEAAFARGFLGQTDPAGSNHLVANTLGLLAMDATLIFSGPEAAGEETIVRSPEIAEPPAAPVDVQAAGGGQRFFRGAKPGQPPDFTPRPNEFKVDPATGTVKPTHGVSVFDNPESVSSKGFVPHEVDQATVPSTLRIKQRGADPAHHEIMPAEGTNLTPNQFTTACQGIGCKR